MHYDKKSEKEDLNFTFDMMRTVHTNCKINGEKLSILLADV